MLDKIQTDILVAGNGPAGLIATLALARLGLKVILVGPATQKTDMRTTALMMPSIKMLQHIGVWADIEPHAAPLRSMRILDGTQRLVRSRPVTFQAAEIEEQAFGWNMPNAMLSAALQSAVSKNNNITHLDTSVASYNTQQAKSDAEQLVSAKIENGGEIVCKLIVGADGRNSLAREAAGIDCTRWSYPQSALVTTFAHTRAHENCSTEFHTATGPFTLVPLPGNRSSLVWVLKPETAQSYLVMEADALSLLIEKQMQSILGKISVSADRQLYPLSGQYPSRFAKNRIALIGEAAHLFPPIGAQGLNLGIRDVEDLLVAIEGDASSLGNEHQLDIYDRKRRPDIMARTGAVDALNRSLLTSFLPAQIVRSLGLATLDVLPPLRALFMREGLRPGSGFTALLSSFKKVARG